MLTAPFTPRRPQRQLPVLDDVSGSLLPGTLTLVLAPPGHSKSSLLKALAGRLPPSKLGGGHVAYSGVPLADAAAVGVNARQLVALVGQEDLHLPQLTVRETLQFAFDNACVVSSAGWTRRLGGAVRCDRASGGPTRRG
jgi:ABC-type multidrug transport system ATPase subunit